MTDQEKTLYHVEGLPIPETPRPGESPTPWKGNRIIGKAVPRVDAYERVSGSAVYPSDVSLPNMLYGAILRCPHPHARIKKIETSKTKNMSGVRAVISGQTPAAAVKTAEPMAQNEYKIPLFRGLIEQQLLAIAQHGSH